MSKATAEDKRRITELFDQAYETDDSIEDIFRRIAKEMPHVTDADIQEVAAVYAKEGAKLEPSVTASTAAKRHL